jgi:hypothetical protein
MPTSNTIFNILATANLTMAEIPKRDKFAAMEQRQQATIATAQSDPPVSLEKRDKFAAMAQRETSAASVEKTTDSSAVAEKELQRKHLQTRKDQRNQVWKDLQDAESAIVHLLHLAHATALQFSKATTTTTTDNTDTLTTTSQSAAYIDTLSTIHAKLSGHAELVQAYQAPSRVNPPYLSRVELMLAKQKKTLLEELVSLESEPIESLKEGHDDVGLNETNARSKRKRDE